MRRLAAWFFSSPRLPISPWSTIVWWELRRIPFNILVAVYGTACLIIFFWAITTSGQLGPGEDAVEPVALLATPLVINALYTLGWLVEVPVRWFVPSLSSRLGPVLLKVGLGLGTVLISLPAAIWMGYRIAQLIRLAP
ncbi:MAG: hypothetical protein GXY83_10190 [Rhodopirellula sp.]|nr:hypothetical protein [Rhodopirellula sp.]